mmetsp:Transcript_23406/g.36616  ORF Transcript_23406/g.36616 Transcript_23406/m.36616 type:complete len:170 (+) Transcript_23406:641-1150(+)
MIERKEAIAERNQKRLNTKEASLKKLEAQVKQQITQVFKSEYETVFSHLEAKASALQYQKEVVEYREAMQAEEIEDLLQLRQEIKEKVASIPKSESSLDDQGRPSEGGGTSGNEDPSETLVLAKILQTERDRYFTQLRRVEELVDSVEEDWEVPEDFLEALEEILYSAR